jgi:NAD(P)-dependent dehydrogenase (short-subunit alcohol dehydrogenase family)
MSKRDNKAAIVTGASKGIGAGALAGAYWLRRKSVHGATHRSDSNTGRNGFLDGLIR